MVFKKESDFEEALIKILSEKGWEKEVIKYPTEKELIQNWANILFDNNRGQDRLDKYPLTEGEMQQIIEQIMELRTPLKLNGFINGKTVSVKRDNPDDKLHFGKEISLKIYDRQEIAAGQSRYQIVQQPVFPSKSKMLNDRRGDLMLLINGMPVIHIELKKSGVPVSQAYHQIEKYAYEGVFARHCKECNIPVISIHGLRHTHASLLLFTGVSIASVARRLGHSSMTTTQKTYLHIIQELENKDIDLVMRSLSSLS